MKPNYNKLYQQVRLLDPLSNTDKIADVLITDNKITAIDSHISPPSDSIEIINAEGLILAPGLVDLYSCSGAPGHEERETFISFTQAAIAGGFTRVSILPSTIPTIDNPATLSFLQQKLSSNQVKFYFWGALTQDLQGQQLSELADLANAGVIGFTDNQPRHNLNLLRRLLEYTQPFNLPVALVPIDLKLQENGVMREGDISLKLGLSGDPTISETVAIASILELVETTKTSVHLMRISTARSVELIKLAKERNLPITASTSWMHLLLNTEAIASYNPNLRLNPPLGSEKDRLALIEGIKQGVIDAIAVDHTPYTYEEKTVAFAQAPAGAMGLELILPLLWENLVEKRLLSGLQLWTALSLNPLLCLKQEPINITIGQPAELILFNPNQIWQVTPQNLQSIAYNTPWLGKQIKGKIHHNVNI